MPSLDRNQAGPAYWRSLDELADTPEFRTFVEREFPNFAPELLTGTTRRGFLKLMGASLALAGLAGCRWPRETIVPHARPPQNRVPGVPVQYATAWELGGSAQGLLVTSYDGRPVKIEGNDRHPLNQGATDALAQASILELYDPDRLKRPLRRGGTALEPSTWDAFADWTRAQAARLGETRGARLAVLSEATGSPTVHDLRRRLLERYPEARWYEYEPISRDAEREGTRLAFGQPYRVHLDLSKADVIVSFDSDFLVGHPAAVQYARAFARRRRPDPANQYDMSRLYVLESTLSVTGARADVRAAVRPSELAGHVRTLQLALAQAETGSTTVGRIDLAALAAELQAHRGRCALLVGPQHPPEVHAVVQQLNAQLGNIGETVLLLPDPEPGRPAHGEALAALVARLNAGELDTLVMLGGNPVYNAPADLDFAAALQRATERVHLATYPDETGALCTWVLPRAHPLEAWGDARAWDGTVSLIQPLIEPLYQDAARRYGGRTAPEVLALLAGEDVRDGYALTRRTFDARLAEREVPTAAEQGWTQALHDGVVAGSAWAAVAAPGGAAAEVLLPAAAGGDGYELVFAPDYTVYDGRFANNGWLQELPDPLTKLTWDNAALLAPAAARALGVRRGDVVKIELGGRALEIAAFVLPGLPTGTIVLPLGYGARLGRVSDGAGVNTYALRTSDAATLARGARVSRTGRKYTLATTQDHHYMDTAVGQETIQARIPQLIREATLGEFRHDPHELHHVVHLPIAAPLWQEHDYGASGHNRWAMTIDLSACIGCGACVVACQAENNIPVVGKDEVERGREMHWLRVDRYFKGDPDDVDGVALQPVTCHHCENAPCEQVCPVAATVHDEDGLNVMVYNRCVGTRYCSNNCPYKVRRFNWFKNHHGPKHPRHGQDVDEIERMVFNPEVTVRSRGVMEKCTFCTQRINMVKIAQRNAGQPVADGQITPACAQACPTEAIVFGDLNDPASRVARLFTHDRAYGMLAELNVKPRLNYLARITNPPGPAAHGH
jgi:MoCo/4Fe-4S cofactor protein with predicted Tat translocation signal